MPEGFIAAIVITFILGVFPICGILFYKLILCLLWKKAEGKVIGFSNGMKQMIPLNTEEGSEKPEDDSLLKPVIQFEADAQAVKVVSHSEYDFDVYKKLFPENSAVVYYIKNRPDKNFIIKSEFNKRFISLGLKLIIAAILAIAVEAVIFIYMGMYR